jgi:hydroxymethylpyrimidine pyrophosphatase-like HAD family hydrolase
VRYFALATDYDGTLADDGIVPRETLAALKRLRASGRLVILVTGRELPDLKQVFPEYKIFDLIVAENGAVLYEPSSNTETVLAAAPPEEFATMLAAKDVGPLHSGRVIVSTLEDYQGTVLETIRELGLELQMIFNKGSLMVLPSGVNKATGLKAAAEKLCLSVHNIVAVGDAENDHAFLSACERGIAVANSLSSLKETADFVTRWPSGKGVSELIDLMVREDLAHVPAKRDRDSVLLGKAGGQEVRIPGYGSSLLVAGTSGGGKSMLTTGIMERLHDAGYQFLAIDPEGDYQNFEGALILGDAKGIPTLEEILKVIEIPEQSLIVNLIGVAVDDRPTFFESLWPRLQELRTRTGRPHWIVLDEAHHLAPANREKSKDLMPSELISTMFITIEPDHLAQGVLPLIDTIIALGEKPAETIGKFSGASGTERPSVRGNALDRGKALLWSRKTGGDPQLLDVAESRTDQVRHSRKYATAELTPDRSFYFRGPAGKLRLRAQNVTTFVQLSEGVDDETWIHHLRNGDYSTWFRENIKNGELADAIAKIEKEDELTAAESRARIRELIEQRFTLPA